MLLQVPVRKCISSWNPRLIRQQNTVHVVILFLSAVTHFNVFWSVWTATGFVGAHCYNFQLTQLYSVSAKVISWVTSPTQELSLNAGSQLVSVAMAINKRYVIRPCQMSPFFSFSLMTWTMTRRSGKTNSRRSVFEEMFQTDWSQRVSNWLNTISQLQ